MAGRPNVLLIVADQWRWDCLGAAGHPVVQTPHLDLLAGEGTRFTSAYSAVPSCIAARVALMTGLNQRHHGRIGYRDRVEWNYPVTLAGTFAEAGYHTQAVGKMHVYPARSLLGFHNVILHDGYLHWNRTRDPGLMADDDYLPDLRQRYGPAADYTDSGIGCNGYVVAPWPYDPLLHPTGWVTSQAIDFLRRRDKRKPFFLMASYHRPHPPLDPPQSYLDIYRDLDLPPVTYGDWNGGEGLPTTRRRGQASDSPRIFPKGSALIDRARRAYFAQITFIDHQINRLIMALLEQHVYEDTTIVFMSDHGEMLFDHELDSKGSPYQGSAGIPLIIRPAGGAAQKGGLVDAPVELRDLFPTLCALSGVPIPEGLDGMNTAPFIYGEKPDWREVIHGEHESGRWSNHWLTDGKMKYAWFSQTGREQIFDLQTDPNEQTDLAQAKPIELAAWRSRLVKALEGREEGYTRDGALVVGRPTQSILNEAGLE